MIDADSINSIISVYVKHGWTLRRVLLSNALKTSLGETYDFGDAEVTAADFDALWFSRTRNDHETAWEIRHISNTAYALVAVVDSEQDDEAATLAETQQRFAATLASRTKGH